MTINKLNDQQVAQLNQTIAAALCVGQKVTIISVSECLAHTQKSEGTIVSLANPPEFRPEYSAATHGKYRAGTFKIGRKHNAHYLDLDASTLIFRGWGLAIKPDSEVKNIEGSTGFVGDAMLNLSAPTLENLKGWIDQNLNPLFTSRDKVVFVPEGYDLYDDSTRILVYPEAPTDSSKVQERRLAAA